MEYNDIIRRRQTPQTSAFSRELLPQAQKRNNGQRYRQHYSENGQIKKNIYQPPVVQEGIPVDGEKIQDNFLDHPTFYEQQRKLQYWTSPKPPSIRRTFSSQTPLRTTPYTSIHDGLDNIKQKKSSRGSRCKLTVFVWVHVLPMCSDNRSRNCRGFRKI